MADERPVQLPRGARGVLLVAVSMVIVCVSALPLLEPVGADTTHPGIRSSAQWPVMLWCASSAALLIGVRAHNFATIWALGCALLWVHVAVAFHLGHGWSHQAAWEHTRQVGGYGDGVFVNYAFALVWLCDALWALVASASYQARPRWLHWAVHGFLAFVVVNAAFVFAGWGTRVMFVLCCSLGVIALRYTRQRT